MIKHVIFDFGNVIGRFDAQALMRRFCADEADRGLLLKAVFHDWEALDAGRSAYADYIGRTLELLPARLHGAARRFFQDWCENLPYVDGMPELLAELKERGVPLYLLSNAPAYFAEHLDSFDVLRGFSGIVISGEIRVMKPAPEIYTYLLQTYGLPAEQCFFVDDLEANAAAARNCGMHAHVFNGEIGQLREALLPALAERACTRD